MTTLALDARHRRASGLARRRRAVAFLLAAVVAVALSVARTADAAPFPFVESFRDATAPEFAFGGNPGSPAILTAGNGDAAGAGWLRLTPAVTDRFGFAYHRTAFPSGDGLVFEFDYAAWGGGSQGADGITFALFDGATTDAQFRPGPAGGSLGYTACNTGNGVLPGLSNAYMAVGLDEYGNFANTEFCQQSGPAAGLVPNRISIRGGVPDYPHLRSVIASQGVAGARAQARRLTVTVLPKDGTTTVSAEIRYPDGTVQPIATDVALPTPPPTLKFGFTASTGGSVNNHEIRDLRVAKPTDLRVDVAPEPTSTDRNGVQEYVARIVNAGPNDATGVVVDASAPHTTDVAWTCSASGGATCVAASGTGFPDGDVGPLPEGGELTFRITSRLTDDADDSSLRFSADPTGDTSETTPADNVADARTDVTPGLDAAPTLTLAPDGLATATSGRAYGGTPTRVVQWLRCSPTGDDCSEIAGAVGPTYLTSDADRGSTLRVRETVTNDAGWASAVSLALTLPQTFLPPVPVTAPESEPPTPLPPADAGVVPNGKLPAGPPPVVPGSGSGDDATDRGPSDGATDGTLSIAPFVPQPGGPLGLPTAAGPLGASPFAGPFVAREPVALDGRTISTGTYRSTGGSARPTTRTFVIDGGVVSASVRRRLSALLPPLRRATAVRCVGFTDSRGSSTANRRLGLRRAQAVCRSLRRIGVTGKLSSSSRGEQQPRASNRTAAGRKENRRVELTVRY